MEAKKVADKLDNEGLECCEKYLLFVKYQRPEHPLLLECKAMAGMECILLDGMLLGK
jgi:hypothetical protein